MTARSTLRTVLAAALVTAAAGCAAHAPRPGGPAPSAAKPDGGMKPWAEVTKSAEVKRGFFDVYTKREHLYLAIPESRLGEEFLGIFTVARGVGAAGVLGGMPVNDRMLAFERHGDRVLLVDRDPRFVAPAGTPVAKALELSRGHSVLASLKIESVHDSSKALLVDFASVVVSDVTDGAHELKAALDGKAVRFDKDRSAVTGIKNFPDNLEIEALLTYTPSDHASLDVPSVPDIRYLPVGMHYSFSRLPERPMQPRLADPRVGYFLSAKKDYGNDTAENFWVRYLKRWRLEKKDPAAAVSDPVQPIVFYVDRTVPLEYRPWVKRGIENWQRGFEAAGFSNAIVAKDAPDDPDWDAEDVRYSTVRWIASSDVSFNAIGPSRMDPRTGEILDADVLIEAAALQGYRNWWRRYAAPTDVASGVAPTPGDAPAWLPAEMRCDDQASAADQGAILRLDLLLAGAIEPGAPVPDEFLEPLVVRLVMHEIGHTLGLRHNFRSSTSTPYEKLHDAAWTREHGLIGSVMDYVTPNIAADRSRQGEYFISGLGPYDVWAIRYGYAASGESDLEKDRAFATRIADESLAPELAYSTDDDTYPAGALDPRSNVYDLSDDPLRWAEDRAAYLAALWRNPRFESRVLGEDGEYPVLRRAMDVVLQQYGLALGMAVKYVGGQYQERVHKGQPGAVEPLRPVSAERQRAALEFLGRRAFARDAFDAPPALLGRLAADRWTHWGAPNPFSPSVRVDYDFTDRVFAIQSALLARLTHPALLARLREAENRSRDPYTLAEHFDRMTRMLWDDVSSAAGLRALEGPSSRRLIQRAWVDRLAAMVVDGGSGVPDDARALARLQLERIDARAARAEGMAAGDATRAHLLESRARIRRALDASRTADVRRGGGGPPGSGGGAH